MSTITENKYKTFVFEPRITCMQSINSAQKRVKITRSHKIAESIQSMIEELKKTKKKKLILIFWTKQLSFL